MLAISAYTVGDTVTALGYWANGDGGGGTFTYTSSSAEDNGGTIFQPNGETGNIRLIRDTSAFNYINALWFGVRGDDFNLTDNDARLEKAAALAHSEKSGNFYLPSGIYQLRNGFGVSNAVNGLNVFSDLLETEIAVNSVFANPAYPNQLRRSSIVWSPHNDPQSQLYNKFRIHKVGTGAVLKRADSGYALSGNNSYHIRIYQTAADPNSENTKLSFTFTNIVFDGNRQKILDSGNVPLAGVLVRIAASPDTTLKRQTGAENISFNNCIIRESHAVGLGPNLSKSTTEEGIFLNNVLIYNCCRSPMTIGDWGSIGGNNVESHSCGFDEIDMNLPAGGGFGFDFAGAIMKINNLYIHHSWHGFKTVASTMKLEITDALIEYNFFHGVWHGASSTTADKYLDNVIIRKNGRSGINWNVSCLSKKIGALWVYDNNYSDFYEAAQTWYNALIYDANIDMLINGNYGAYIGNRTSAIVLANCRVGYLESVDNAVHGASISSNPTILSGKIYNNVGRGINLPEGVSARIYRTRFGDTQTPATQTEYDIGEVASASLAHAGLEFAGSQAAQNIGVTSVTPVSVSGTATLNSPADLATNQSLIPTLYWNAFESATSYLLQISADNFENILYAVEVTGLSHKVRTGFLTEGGTYKWRVYAIVGTSSISNWSVARTFSTVGALTEPPGAPTLSSPLDQAVDVSRFATLEWLTEQGATSYLVQVADNDQYTDPIVNTETSNLYYSLSLLDYETTYYWRIAAKNSYGTSGWTNRSFTTVVTDPPLETPSITSPTQNQEGVVPEPTITWSSIGNADTYDFQLANNPEFTTPIINETLIAGLSHAVSSPLSYNTPYYARVRAVNTNGTSFWSTTIRFWIETEETGGLINVDEAEVVGTSTTTDPVGKGSAIYGAYVYHGLYWLFYNNGTNIVFRIRDVEGTTPPWSAETTVIAANTSFATASKDGYLHYSYIDGSGNVKYRRGALNANGTISWNTEVTAYDGSTWAATTAGLCLPAMIVDHDNHVWILQKVNSGSNYKAILLSSTNTSGGWTSRTNFPKDIIPSASSSLNVQRNLHLREIEDGKICAVGQNYTSGNTEAVVWTEGVTPDAEGTLGSAETIASTFTNNYSSLIRHNSTVYFNANTNIYYRNSNGTWSAATSTSSGSAYSGLTSHDSKLRWWRALSTSIRYWESLDHGATWPTQSAFEWTTNTTVCQVAQVPDWMDGEFYMVLWADGAASPYNVNFGIVGTVGGIVPATAPAKVSLSTPTDTATDVAQLTSFGWVATDATNHYQLQVALDSGFTNVVRDIAYILTNSHQLSSELVENTTHYWRVRAINEVGNGEWSDTRSFTTIADTPEDQANLNRIVTWGTTTSPSPVGNSINRSCEWLVGLRSWVFYTNGTDLVCRNKQIADGGAISNEIVVQAGITLGGRFDICLHNGYFHLIYMSSNDLKYRRLTPNNDGTLTVGTERTAYTDATWDVTLNYQSIEVDQSGNIFAQFMVTDGTNYKPVVTANDSGLDTWTTRSGFPVDLQVSNTSSVHGQSSVATFLANNVIAFVWRDAINSRISCAIWDNGVLGSILGTGLSVTSSWRVSAVSLDGYLFINSGVVVARRTPAGVWSILPPSGLEEWNYVHLEATDKKIRLVSRNDTDVRFVDSAKLWGLLDFPERLAVFNWPHEYIWCSRWPSKKCSEYHSRRKELFYRPCKDG
jgi:hypothetical protein